METLSRVSPVFATKPAETGWGDRWYLLAHAADLAADPQAQRAARTWRVRFVFVDDRHFDGTPPPILHAAALAQSAAYEQVWHRGHVTIFEIRVGY
jgi:hypothetical protein